MSREGCGCPKWCRDWSGGIFVFVDEAVAAGSFGRVGGAACRDGLSAVVLPVRAAGVSESRFLLIATVPSVASQPPICGLDPSTATTTRPSVRVP